MKKLVPVSARTLLFFFVVMLTNKDTNGQQLLSGVEVQKNKAANDQLLKAFQTGDVSGFDAVISPEFVNHAIGDQLGADSLKAGIQLFYVRFKPTKVEVKTSMMDGEYFSDWIRYTGAGPNMVFEGIEVTKSANGKAVDHWFFPGGQRRR